jgi:hypothetical protein
MQEWETDMKPKLLAVLLTFSIIGLYGGDTSLDNLQEGVYHELYTGKLKEALKHFEKAFEHRKNTIESEPLITPDLDIAENPVSVN